jgi:opacity protein-like surface antigen
LFDLIYSAYIIGLNFNQKTKRIFMKKQIQKVTLMAITPAILASSSLTVAANAEDRYVYLGVEGGISEPVVKDFEETVGTLTTKMRLKQSRMYGGRVGYSFYPGMSVELSVRHQPKYKLAYRLPAYSVAVAPGVNVNVAEIPGITKISADEIMLGLVYQFQDQYAGLKPYVIFGAGVSKLHIRAQDAETNAFVPYGGGVQTTFRIKDNKIKCFSWQFGGGIVRDITDNISIDLGAKLRVVNGIKLKYDVSDGAGGFNRQKPIKKTLGVGEFTLGFLFKLPV